MAPHRKLLKRAHARVERGRHERHELQAVLRDDLAGLEFVPRVRVPRGRQRLFAENREVAVKGKWLTSCKPYNYARTIGKRRCGGFGKCKYVPGTPLAAPETPFVEPPKLVFLGIR